MFVIVGCGFLGSRLLQKLSACAQEPVVATVRAPAHILPLENVAWVTCDVTQRRDLERLAERCGSGPKTVFYFAASHNVDNVFLHPQAARKVNVEALEAFFQTMPGIDRLFFSSTDCVYGESGEDRPGVSESSPTRPMNEYGKQKLEAEQLVRSRGFTVLRFGLLLGPSLLPHRPSFYDTVCRKLAASQPVEMIDGMRRSVLGCQNAAELLWRLAQVPKDRLPPVLNVCSDDAFTKYELGCLLAERMQAPKDLVCKITAAQGARFFKDARAACTVMDNSLLKRTLGISSIPWENLTC